MWTDVLWAPDQAGRPGLTLSMATVPGASNLSSFEGDNRSEWSGSDFHGGDDRVHTSEGGGGGLLWYDVEMTLILFTP